MIRVQVNIKPTHCLIDMVIVAASVYLAFLLRVGDDVFTIYRPIFTKLLITSIIVRPIVFIFLGVYKIIWRYVTANDSIKLAEATVISSLAVLAVSFMFDVRDLPRSVFVIEMIVCFLGLTGVRLIRRSHFESRFSKQLKEYGRPTLVLGGGVNGRNLIKRLKTDSHQRCYVVGLLDDDEEKRGKAIEGISVVGKTSELEEHIKAFNAKQVYIAIQNPPGHLVKSIYNTCKKHNIVPLIVTDSTSDSGHALRPLKLADLLSRPQRFIDFSSIKKLIQNKTVLVTGAGGSIGSELARQVSKFDPKQLIILDHNEFALYQIDRELRINLQDTNKVTPALVDIKDYNNLEALFSKNPPDLILHAAAYKHVHLVEANPYSTIINNVKGTSNLVDLSKKFDVPNFVLVSTDKAVNPVGVMGATKRVCEIIVTTAGMETQQNYCSVRFGNVLGSSGSLIPLLQEQIKNGGPVTVTHEKMTRYFMLIPEAVSLVLTTATLSSPGDLNVLKMGEPVKILDIAKNLIELMNKTEDEIQIEFIGLRPGEKMYEELYISGNELKTSHPDILTVPKGDNIPQNISTEEFSKIFQSLLNQMMIAAEKQNPEAIRILDKVVQGAFDDKVDMDTHALKILN